ncbi:MAG: hypothetical protein ACKV2O_02320 [Acidimicrobiales bacterium]
MKKRLAFMAVWLLGTVASITLAWSAVAIVGGQVTNSDGGSLSADQVARAVSISTLPGATSSSAGSVTRVTMAAPAASTTTTATTVTTPPATQTIPPAVVPNSTGPEDGGSVPNSGTTAPATSVTQDRSGEDTTTSTLAPTATTPPASGPLQYFNAGGGSVGMRCSGDAAALAFATPIAGWTMSVHDSGPEKVDVEFNDSQDNRSRIIVRCNRGVPSPEIKER